MLKNSDVDFYLFSYVLTETRGKWEVFMRELVREAKPNALFYFAEPTPWQLHQVRLLLPDLDYIWLDSSMNQLPNLQALEARLGPGVLLARKK
jgi:SAM-dependent methyltransferase